MNEPPPKAPRPGSLGGNPAGTHGRGCSLPARPPAAGLQREELGARVHGSQGPPAAAGAAPQHHHGGAAGPPGGAAPTEAAPRPAADPSASHGALHLLPPLSSLLAAGFPLPAVTEGRLRPLFFSFFGSIFEIFPGGGLDLGASAPFEPFGGREAARAAPSGGRRLLTGSAPALRRLPQEPGPVPQHGKSAAGAWRSWMRTGTGRRCLPEPPAPTPAATGKGGA